MKIVAFNKPLHLSTAKSDILLIMIFKMLQSGIMPGGPNLL